MEIACGRLLWAKLSKTDDRGFHPLICHLLDAGAVAEQLWLLSLGERTRRWFANAFGLDEDDAGRWVAFWAALHDIGKATPTFQGLAGRAHQGILDALVAGGLDFGPGDKGPRHDVLTASVLHRIFQEPVLGRQMAMPLAMVLGGHHGVFPLALQVAGVSKNQTGAEKWQRAQDRLFQALASHWGVDALPRPEAPSGKDQAVYMFLAGLVCVADWLASWEQFFPYAGADVDLEGYVRGLPDRAEAAAKRAGFAPCRAPCAELNFSATFDFPANPMQALVGEHARALTGPSLLLIECPMGQGKTEAAFAVLHDALRRLGHRGAYIALPTQATSDQMFRRFCRFAPTLAVDSPVQTVLLHGHAMLNKDFEAVRMAGVLEDSPAADEAVAASEWFCASKRGLLAQFGIGTIDQSLLGVVQVRHQFVRLFGLADKVVILDEVHAYDTYTSELLGTMLHWLSRLGCSVVVLSATLPAARRRALVDAFLGHQAELSSVKYPRLTVATEGFATSVELKAQEGKTVGLRGVPDCPEKIAGDLADALANGGCAACVCNTVDRAQTLYQAVRDKLKGPDCEVLLLHARFPYGRRSAIEEEVVTRLGKEGWHNGTRPTKAVLVSTQVIEQSLDLDFDLMVTDLAPVDLVLQRSGRLHRHAEVDKRPTVRPAGLAEPKLWLVRPPLRQDGVPNFGTHEFVYDRYLLLCTHLCLLHRQRSQLAIPQDIDLLIEQVYSEHPTEGPDAAWRAALREAWEEVHRERHRDTFHAGCRSIPPPDAPDGFLHVFNQQLPDDEDVAGGWSLGGLTRKATPSVQVVLLHRTSTGYALGPKAQDPVDLDRAPPREQVLALLGNAVRLSRWAIVEHFKHQAPHAAWRKCPVLRNHFPLILEDGRCRFGRTEVLLDPELGVVYRQDTAENEGEA